jgi:hypothetical protein
VPPAIVIEIAPVVPPKQFTFVVELVLIDNAAAGCVSVKLGGVSVQPCASVTVRLYVPYASDVRSSFVDVYVLGPVHE